MFIAGKTVRSMPEHFKVVCIPCKALYKCSAFFVFLPFKCYISPHILDSCIMHHYMNLYLFSSDDVDAMMSFCIQLKVFDFIF